MQSIDRLLALTRDKQPWALARFNDGEMTAIAKREGKISRGLQKVTPGLADALAVALSYRQSNYWIGLPCGVCWKKHRAAAIRLCSPALWDYTTLAVVLTNRNHQRWQEEFPDALGDREVHWIGPRSQDLKKLPFKAKHYLVTGSINAFEVYDAIDEDWKDLPLGAVVMTSCGPLGRIIAHRWYDARPDLTIIDVGSIYDPLTWGTKTARIHKGTLPRCKGCH